MQTIKKRVPQPLKSSLVKGYRWIRHHSLYRLLFHHPRSLDSLLEYWKKPSDGHNLPESYLEGKPRSEFLVGLIDRLAPASASILEVGCNVGRNLHYLFQAGFTNLTGIEISKEAVQLLQHTFPDMAKTITVHDVAAEEILPRLGTDAFRVVFTMAVLEHIHTDSEWLFGEIVRVTKDMLITIEDEEHLSWRHFPRNYRNIFEPLGMQQIYEQPCDEIPGLGTGFMARVFKKSQRT